jgi:hypothetical protein
MIFGKPIQTEPILCQYCKRDISNEIAIYGTCHICKKSILFECEKCHIDIVHKEYQPEDIAIIKTTVGFSENSSNYDALSEIEKAKRSMPWWNAEDST